MSQNGRFLTGSTMGHVARMTVTGLIGLTFMFLVDVANLFWVSLMGVERLVAALGFAWTIQFFSVSSGIGLMIAVTAMVSKAIGQGQRDEARRQTTVTAIVTFSIQAIVATLIVVFRHDILALAGAKGQTALDAARYLAISVPSLPFMALGMVGTGVLRAEGDAVRAMNVTLLSGLVSMFVDPMLIFGLGLGLDGAALAMVFARLMSATLSVYYILRVHDLAGRVNRADLARFMPPFLAIAVPAVLTQLSTPFGNYIVTSAVAGFGDGAVAGWAVVSRLTVLAFGGVFALSGAIGGILGQNFGAGNFDRVKTTYRDALLFCVAYVSLAWGLLAACTLPAIRAFGLSEAGAEVVSAFTLLAAGGFLFTGALFVSNASFNSLGRPLYSTLFNWSRDGVLMFPIVGFMAGLYAAPGVIYGQALSAVIAGSVACFAGWTFVKNLKAKHRG